MKRFKCDFSVKLCEDNFSSFGVFYVNAKDISEAFDKMVCLLNSNLASYDELEIISIMLV